MRGKGKNGSECVIFPKDHPRLCGEKYCRYDVGYRCRGSPPPMRGKEIDAIMHKIADRITPAYAGKSCRCRYFVQHIGDHPRLCGEKFCLPLRIQKKLDHPRLCGEKTKKIPKQRYFFHQPASFSFSLQYT